MSCHYPNVKSVEKNELLITYAELNEKIQVELDSNSNKIILAQDQLENFLKDFKNSKLEHFEYEKWEDGNARICKYYFENGSIKYYHLIYGNYDGYGQEILIKFNNQNGKITKNLILSISNLSDCFFSVIDSNSIKSYKTNYENFEKLKINGIVKQISIEYKSNHEFEHEFFNNVKTILINKAKFYLEKDTFNWYLKQSSNSDDFEVFRIDSLLFSKIN